jgi:hypothetical protein
MIGLIAMNILPTGSEKAEDAIYLAVHYIVHVGICSSVYYAQSI